ncbi:hypothetical protein Tco_0729748 [Tanacetum coccineum]|uniref:Uncharacterized protein n=1 Tax=Tanacetum coccineum TaxID=301880 RepID=A0ABQ4YSI4_9ASTR
MKETYHVTFSEDDEAISQSSTEGDAINFNENRSFPDDEFLELRNNLEPAKIQYNVIIELISNVQSSPTIILPSTAVDINPIGERSRVRDSETALAHECLYVNFLSEMEPKKLIEALGEERWIIARQEELNQFEKNKV